MISVYEEIYYRVFHRQRRATAKVMYETNGCIDFPVGFMSYQFASRARAVIESREAAL